MYINGADSEVQSLLSTKAIHHSMHWLDNIPRAIRWTDEHLQGLNTVGLAREPCNQGSPKFTNYGKPLGSPYVPEEKRFKSERLGTSLYFDEVLAYTDFTEQRSKLVDQAIQWVFHGEIATLVCVASQPLIWQPLINIVVDAIEARSEEGVPAPVYATAHVLDSLEGTHYDHTPRWVTTPAETLKSAMNEVEAQLERYPRYRYWRLAFRCSWGRLEILVVNPWHKSGPFHRPSSKLENSVAADVVKLANKHKVVLITDVPSKKEGKFPAMSLTLKENAVSQWWPPWWTPRHLASWS